MTKGRELYSGAAAIFTVGILTTLAPWWLGARAQTTVPINGEDTGDGVTSATGAEPSVWVIAETRAYGQIFRLTDRQIVPHVA